MHADLGIHVFGWRRRCRNGEADERVHARERQPRGRAHRAHAREHGHPLEHARGEVAHLRPLGVARRRHLDAECHGLLGAEPGVDARELGEAAQQQPGADEQEHGHGDLRHDEHRAQPLARAAQHSARFFPQRAGEVRPRALQRGDAAEQQTGEQRDAERDQEHGEVHSRLLEARDVARLRSHERTGSEPRQAQPACAADQCEHGSFREQLPDQARTPRTKRAAHRQLTLAGAGAREQQVGDVRARDQQHEPDGAEQHEQRCAHSPRDPIAQRSGAEREPIVRRCEAGTQVPADRLQVGIDPLRAEPRPHPPDHRQVLAPATGLRPCVERLVVRERTVHVDVARNPLPRREHADDLVRVSVQLQCAPDHVRAAELALPERVTQHHHALAPGRVLLACEQPPRRGAQADEIAETRARERARHFHHATGGRRHRHGPLAHRDRVLEHAALRPDAHEVRRRERIGSTVGINRADLVQPVRVPIRQRLQQDRVNDAEDRRVRADSERQRQHRHRSEHRGTTQRAQREADVLPKLTQVLPERVAATLPLVDRHALRARHIQASETHQRQLPRALRRLAPRDQLPCPHLDVERELLVHVPPGIRPQQAPES